MIRPNVNVVDAEMTEVTHDFGAWCYPKMQIKYDKCLVWLRLRLLREAQDLVEQHLDPVGPGSMLKYHNPPWSSTQSSRA